MSDGLATSVEAPTFMGSANNSIDTGSATSSAAGGRGARGRYAKFNGGMDVLLLEAIVANNPFTAKHGTRMQMWHSVAEIVGEELFKNPDAYSWHSCRDRVLALLRLYADGKHDKLFKQGTAEENARKEAMLSELSFSIAHKSKVSASHAAAAADSAAMLDAAGMRAPADVVHQMLKPESPPTDVVDVAPAAAAASAVSAAIVMPELKRRRLELAGGSGSPILDSSVHQQLQLQLSEPLAPPVMLSVSAPTSNGAGGHSAPTAPTASAAADADVDSSAFRARVLRLIESKVQFDMEQRVKEIELREQEFELQKRFLEYLQSK